MAVVSLDQDPVARRLAAEGATVVLVGDDAARAGEILAAVEADGRGRIAYFRSSAPATEADLDSLVELVAEQFRSAERGAGAPPAGVSG